ncbi:MAG: hypothetical protein DYG89_13965 [Caldilinea sp. CFX5]|nr:hypothetical protein [Caldilinea sp. CFX5]
MFPGSLVVVGTGIKLVGQVTLEAQAFIKNAEKVLYLVNNEVVGHWIKSLNPTAESLHHFYADEKHRSQTYHEIVLHILTFVRQGAQVCAVFYGHPGVMVTPAHEAIRQARQEGYRAWMLPGISAVDCLFADLGFEPAYQGWQSFEATGFLLSKRQLDTTLHLILWQVGAIGLQSICGDISKGVQLLADILVNAYGSDHGAILYEASQYPTIPPVIEPILLANLPGGKITPLSTLYVPPKATAPVDQEIVARLGMNPDDLFWKRSFNPL